MRFWMLNSLSRISSGSPVDELEPRCRFFSFGGIFKIQVQLHQPNICVETVHLTFLFTVHSQKLQLTNH